MAPQLRKLKEKNASNHESNANQAKRSRKGPHIPIDDERSSTSSKKRRANKPNTKRMRKSNEDDVPDEPILIDVSFESSQPQNQDNEDASNHESVANQAKRSRKRPHIPIDDERPSTSSKKSGTNKPNTKRMRTSNEDDVPDEPILIDVSFESSQPQNQDNEDASNHESVANQAKRSRKRPHIPIDDERPSTSSKKSGTNKPNTERMRKPNEDDVLGEPILDDISFESANNDDDVEIEIAPAPKGDELNKSLETATSETKRNKFKWSIESEWDDLDAALDFLESEGFVVYDWSDLKMGQKFYFRCKSIPQARKTWCSKRYTLFLPSVNLNIQILSNHLEHDHDKLLEGQARPQSDEMKMFIIDLFECGTIRVSDVIRHIDFKRTKYGLFKEEANPTKKQIEYELRKFRSSKIPQMIKLGQLVEWCNQYKEFPTNIDEAFVLSFESSSSDEELSFRFSISTPTLLEKLIDLDTICIDATYKLNYLGFPLMILGTVDRTKRFHPLAYACCSHERTYDYRFVFESVKSAIKTHFNKEFKPKKIIADGADPIRNAFYLAFESAELDIMCFAHVIRNCRKRPFSSKNNKQLILDDIRKIQLAPNRATFNTMKKLFCDKWENLESDFVSYFKKEWLGAHCNWFEGAADYTASTNNGQEGHNAVIKKKITLRRRLPMNEFMGCMANMASDISIQFSTGKRALAAEPDIKRDVFESATRMIMAKFKAFKAKGERNSNYSIYSIPSSACVNPTESSYKALVRATWKTFDEFIVHGYQQFYIVKLSSDNWKTLSTCTCAAFFKQHMCKHIVAIGARSKIIFIPETANPVHLAPTKRKTGRPKRTAKALSLQN